MLKELLPDIIYKAVSILKFDNLCELRLRLNRPITVNYNNSYYYLGQGGLCVEKDAIICSRDYINFILSKASNHSVYSINDELKQGYMSVKGGIRIGITGEVVYQNNDILTLKNFSSLNIRIPHQVSGCAYKISQLIIDESGQVLNTLILGSPGTGKTTILRDLCNQIYKQKKSCNILLLDERMEIASCVLGVPQLNVGNSTDIISGGKKSVNIINGLRSMAPNIIVIDEIGGYDDVKAVEYAVNCGVSIFATIHSKNVVELSKKTELSALIKEKSFKRYIELSNLNGKGTVENIFDENFKPLLRFI